MGTQLKKSHPGFSRQTHREKRAAEARKIRAKIRAWAILNEVTMTEIAEEAGVANSTISNFLCRHFSNKEIAAAFIRKGCPARYFDNNWVKAA